MSSIASSASDLRARKCEPCEGGIDPLTQSQSAELMTSLHEDWRLTDDSAAVVRVVKFAGYHRTLSFVNAVGWIANTEGHHPLLEFGYGQCVVTWTTNAINGLSVNDFICAAKTDQLLEAL